VEERGMNIKQVKRRENRKVRGGGRGFKKSEKKNRRRVEYDLLTYREMKIVCFTS
jgi:hypothetical protein